MAPKAPVSIRIRCFINDTNAVLEKLIAKAKKSQSLPDFVDIASAFNKEEIKGIKADIKDAKIAFEVELKKFITTITKDKYLFKIETYFGSPENRQINISQIALNNKNNRFDFHDWEVYKPEHDMFFDGQEFHDHHMFGPCGRGRGHFDEDPESSISINGASGSKGRFRNDEIMKDFEFIKYINFYDGTYDIEHGGAGRLLGQTLPNTVAFSAAIQEFDKFISHDSVKSIRVDIYKFIIFSNIGKRIKLAYPLEHPYKDVKTVMILPVGIIEDNKVLCEFKKKNKIVQDRINLTSLAFRMMKKNNIMAISSKFYGKSIIGVKDGIVTYKEGADKYERTNPIFHFVEEIFSIN